MVHKRTPHGVSRHEGLFSVCRGEDSNRPAPGALHGVRLRGERLPSQGAESFLGLFTGKGMESLVKPFHRKVSPFEANDHWFPFSAFFTKIQLFGQKEALGTVLRICEFIPAIQTEFCHGYHLYSMISGVQCKCNAYF